MKRRGKGEGGIFQRADGQWVGRLELEPANSGDRRRRTYYARTRREVLDKVDRARAELREGQEPAPARRAHITVGTVLDEYLANMELAGDSKRRELTRIRNTVTAEHQIRPLLGRLPIARLDGDRVEAWQNQLLAEGLAPRTVWKARSVLAGVVRLARRKRPPLIRENPLELVDAPEAGKTTKRALTDAEARRFLRVLRGHQLEPLLMIVLMFGLRRGEVLGLKWSDLDLDAREIVIRRQVQRIPKRAGLQLLEPKSEAGVRVLPLPALLVAQLRAWHLRRTSSEMMFPGSTGKPMEPRRLNRDFDAVLKAAEIEDLTLHELRHSAATILLNLGVPALVVAQLLGHADPAVTLRSYGHVVTAAHREAMDAMDGYIQGLSEPIGYTIGYTPVHEEALRRSI